MELKLIVQWSIWLLKLTTLVVKGQMNTNLDPQLDTYFQAIDNDDIYRKRKTSQYQYPVIFNL